MSCLVLCLNLLKVSKAVLNFTLTLDNCLVHCKSSSKSTARYLTDWVGISCFPCSFLNLEGSSESLVGQNISSIFWTVKLVLLALSQCNKFNRSKFICSGKSCKDLFDCMMFVSSAN